MGEILKNHNLSEAIDFSLEDLADNIEALHGKFYSFEKQGENYYMLVGGQKLDFPFTSPSELLEAMKRISKVLSGREGRLDVRENRVTSGKFTSDSLLDAYIEATYGKSYSFEKSGNIYYMVVAGEKLDVPFTSVRDLLATMRIVSQVLGVYYQSKYEGKLYVSEDIMTRGHAVEGSQLNIYVDNRPILDTTFLSAEAIEKNFGIRVSRDNHVQLERLVNFLNLAISADKYRSSSTISYANK